ncbi:MAG: hypothetical protein PWP65_988 [Clostridia bacterium]|nr:hypothetical protein [Clostridia bacterium]
MKLIEIIRELGLQVANPDVDLDREVCWGYCSDLLSDVMAHAPKDSLWFTIQVHENVIAVALLAEVAGVVITGGRRPEAATLNRAAAERIPVLLTGETTFVSAGRLYRLLTG